MAKQVILAISKSTWLQVYCNRCNVYSIFWTGHRQHGLTADINKKGFFFLMQYGTFHSENNCVSDFLSFVVGHQKVPKGERMAQYLTGVVSTRNQYKYTLCLGNGTQLETLWSIGPVPWGSEAWSEWRVWGMAGGAQVSNMEMVYFALHSGRKSHMYH